MKERLFFNPNWRLSKNKTLELQSGTWQEWGYFNFSIKWNRHTDHAGFDFNVEIFGLYFICTIYDNRHWDYENDKWEIYPKDEDGRAISDSILGNLDGTTIFKSSGVYTKEFD